MSLLINTRRMPESVMTIAIEPQGEIGSEDAGLLRDRFLMVLAATHPERIVVDLEAVPDISEAGLRALRSGCLEATAHDADVVLIHPESRVRAQLRGHGLTDLMDGPAGG